MTAVTVITRDDMRERAMFQDVNVKIQVQMYLKFDADVLKYAFPMDYYIL